MLVKNLPHKILVGKKAIEVELAVSAPLYGLLKELVVGALDGLPPIPIGFCVNVIVFSGRQQKGVFRSMECQCRKELLWSVIVVLLPQSYEEFEVSQHVPGDVSQFSGRFLAQTQLAVAVVGACRVPLASPVIKVIFNEIAKMSAIFENGLFEVNVKGNANLLREVLILPALPFEFAFREPIVGRG
jgi:hypothetical protein